MDRRIRTAFHVPQLALQDSPAGGNAALRALRSSAMQILSLSGSLESARLTLTGI